MGQKVNIVEFLFRFINSTFDSDLINVMNNVYKEKKEHPVVDDYECLLQIL